MKSKIPQKHKVKRRKNEKFLGGFIFLIIFADKKRLIMKYLERIIDKQLRLRLEAFGAVQMIMWMLFVTRIFRELME